MKRTITRLAAVSGAAALSLSLAACGGGGDSADTAEGTTEAATTTEDATTEAATTEAATTDAATTDAAPVSASEADLEPAKQRVVDFYKSAGGGDLDTACGMVYDSSTGTGMSSGTMLDACKQGLEPQMETLKAAGDVITPDLLEAEVGADGVININAGGTTVPVRKGADGQLYIDFLAATGG